MCAAGLAVAAVVMWLLGKTVRFVLAGPTKVGLRDGPETPARPAGPPLRARTGH
jgi:hypothetical protein